MSLVTNLDTGTSWFRTTKSGLDLTSLIPHPDFLNSFATMASSCRRTRNLQHASAAAAASHSPKQKATTNWNNHITSVTGTARLRLYYKLFLLRFPELTPSQRMCVCVHIGVCINESQISVNLSVDAKNCINDATDASKCHRDYRCLM